MANDRLQSTRRRTVAVLAGLFATLPLGAASAADLLVEIEAEPAVVASLTAASLSARAGGASVAIVDRGGRRVVVRTTAGGYDNLLADDGLDTVRLLSGDPEAAAADAAAGRSYSILLTTGSGEGVEATSDAAATAGAALIETTAGATVTPSVADRLGPGTLMVRGLAADGATLSERIVDDPRLVRYEAVDSRSAFNNRRDFLRASALLVVALPADPRVTRLAILAPPAPGRSGGRPLATVDLP